MNIHSEYTSIGVFFYTKSLPEDLSKDKGEKRGEGGKEKLNFEAIGQVLVYKDLLEEDYPKLREVKMGIACFKDDKRLEPMCKKLGIEVFVLA